jgi:serine/threonine-protein kinase
MSWWQDDLDEQRLGIYRIEEKIGQGGMAEVFRAVIAEGVRKDWKVAIKVPLIGKIPPDDLPHVLGRFANEIRLQNAEPIPHTVKLIDAGEIIDRRGVQRPFLVMEYLGGGSLGSRLGGSAGRRTCKQTLAEVMKWLKPITQALDDLHARQPKPVLHRDVKPDNILFNTQGQPYLSDFGIAKALTEDGTLSGPTGTGGWSPGSPGYQAPEAVAGDAQVSSDQLSLAVSVYEALSGRFPFEDVDDKTLNMAIRDWALVPLDERCPDDLPGAASSVVMKAMSKAPWDRFHSCMEFAQALDAAMKTEAPRPPRARATRTPSPSPLDFESHGQPAPSPKLKKSRAWLGWSGAAVLLAGIGVSMAMLWQRPRHLPEPPRDAQERVIAQPETQSAQMSLPEPKTAIAKVEESVARKPKSEPSELPLKGILLVHTDSACELSLDGEKVGRLETSRSYDLVPGQHLVECVNTKPPSQRYEETKTVVVAQQSVVQFKFGSVQSIKKPFVVATSTPAVTIPKPLGRFEQVSDGVMDNQEGIIWASRDNGSDIDWVGASNYCRSMGLGWSLPTAFQLQSLFDKSSSAQEIALKRGAAMYFRLATPLIQLTGPWLWSSDNNGRTRATAIHAVDGSRSTGFIINSDESRALCARRS